MIAPWLDRFFRQRRVAVLALPRAGRSPLATPVWFDWDGARFRVQVEATSAKARLFAGAEPVPVALTVQSEVAPYRYAVVHGRATLRPNDRPGLRLHLARRYFGRGAGDQYVAGERARGIDDAALRIIEIEPRRVVAHDFHSEAGVLGRVYFAVWRWFHPVPA